ncbi:lanthionine synthetase C family protein [Streptomyces triculaminicus]|uniref:lanthionine synthetase C family protein n=1 Tax=Streptomyces triculaminicus TaxID=2816232 RepID=UPI0033F29EBE
MTARNGMRSRAASASRERAAEVVAHVATRLADPAEVAARCTGGEERLWQPLSLSDGHPGVALLFAELAAHDPAFLRTAHRHLTAAARGTLPDGGLFNGVTALAFAATASAAAHADHRAYGTLLQQLDERVVRYCLLLSDHERERRTGSPGSGPTAWNVYDVVTGLSGVGRYLLLRGDSAAAGRAARALVSVCAPVQGVRGPVPGWWAGHSPGTDADAYPEGHLNLGLAHGAPGILAFLALAWRQGCRVDGQRQVMGTIVDWLLDRADSDNAGPYWTYAVAPSDDTPAGTSGTAGLPARTAWCYGSPGIARALWLAGHALGNPSWRQHGLAALLTALERPATDWGVHDASLCHGWAGLLQIVTLMARDCPDAGLEPAVDHLAAQALSAFDAASPFGFRQYLPSGPVSRPGFLEGASGTALALHGYARAAPPRTPWEAALLLN